MANHGDRVQLINYDKHWIKIEFPRAQGWLGKGGNENGPMSMQKSVLKKHVAILQLKDRVASGTGFLYKRQQDWVAELNVIEQSIKILANYTPYKYLTVDGGTPAPLASQIIPF